MKPERAFTAAGRAAQHCPELLRRGPSPADLLGRLARIGERMAPSLALALAPYLGGDPATATVLAPRELGESEFAAEIGQLAMNCLFATRVPGVTLLASLDGPAALRLVDRAFGGKGEVAQPLPKAFPLSAELLFARIEVRLGTCLGEALGQEAMAAVRRHPQLAELAPFPAGSRLGVLQVELAEPAGPPWTIRFAVPMPALPRLLGAGAVPSLNRQERGPADPAVSPFADVPLSLSAVLVDMAVPLSAIATLAPGMKLPVTVSRAVPLVAGKTILARGSVGVQDDCHALRLTQIA